MDEVTQKLNEMDAIRREYMKDEETFRLDQELRKEMGKRGQDFIFMTHTGKVYLTAREFLSKHSLDDLSPMSIASLKQAKKPRIGVLLLDYELLPESPQHS